MKIFKTKNPLYKTWTDMKDRCHNPRCSSFKYYGAKGIMVSKEWHDFNKFILDMGPKPTPKHSIDRIDVLKGYSKENCRWATHLEQVRNRSLVTHCMYGHPWTKSSTVWTHNGQGKTRRCGVCLLEYSANNRSAKIKTHKNMQMMCAYSPVPRCFIPKADKFSHDWNEVDCKRCLKRRAK